MTANTELDERYGRKPRRRWRFAGVSVTLPAILVTFFLVVPFIAWLGWVMYLQSTPSVTSQLVGWKAGQDDHEVIVTDFRVDIRKDARKVRCRIQAVAFDKTPVADWAFTPRDGHQEVRIRTERKASSVESLGCTAQGQKTPR